VAGPRLKTFSICLYPSRSLSSAISLMLCSDFQTPSALFQGYFSIFCFPTVYKLPSMYASDCFHFFTSYFCYGLWGINYRGWKNPCVLIQQLTPVYEVPVKNWLVFYWLGARNLQLIFPWLSTSKTPH